MKKKHIFFHPGFLLGAALVLVAFACLSLRNTPVRMGQPPEGVTAAVEGFFEAVCQQDLAAASGYLKGEPELKTEESLAEGYTETLWRAYYASISYEVVGDCYPKDNGICQDVTVTALDIPQLLLSLQDTYHGVMEEAVANTEDRSLIYGENGQYQEQFVLDAIQKSVDILLEGELPTATYSMTLHLERSGPDWKILADSPVLQFLSGHMG